MRYGSAAALIERILAQSQRRVLDGPAGEKVGKDLLAIKDQDFVSDLVSALMDGLS